MGFIEFQVFDGDAAEFWPWISWMEDFFVQKEFTELEKLNLAQCVMEGEAQIWFQWRQSLSYFMSWIELKEALLLRFGKADAAESIKMRDESKPQTIPNPSITRDQVHIVNSEPGRSDNRIGIHMPIFEGVSPYGWISRIERFFRISQVSEAEKLNKVSLSVTGDALTWYKEELDRDEFRDWSEFKRRLVARFAHVKRCLPPQVMLKKESIPKIDQVEELGKETELMPKKDPSMKTDSGEMIDSTMEHELQETSFSNLATYCVFQPPKIGSSIFEELHEASWTGLNESSLVVDELSSGLGMDVLVVHQKEQPVLLVIERDVLAQKSTSVSGIKRAHHLLDKRLLRVTHKKKQRKPPKAWKFKYKPLNLLRFLAPMVHHTIMARGNINSVYSCIIAQIRSWEKGRANTAVKLEEHQHMLPFATNPRRISFLTITFLRHHLTSDRVGNYAQKLAYVLNWLQLDNIRSNQGYGLFGLVSWMGLARSFSCKVLHAQQKQKKSKCFKIWKFKYRTNDREMNAYIEIQAVFEQALQRHNIWGNYTKVYGKLQLQFRSQLHTYCVLYLTVWCVVWISFFSVWHRWKDKNLPLLFHKLEDKLSSKRGVLIGC